MKKNNLKITVVVLFFFFLLPGKVFPQSFQSKIVNDWNRLTVESLERQIKEAGDTALKDKYINRLEGAKSLFRLNDNAKEGAQKSIRAKFIKKIFENDLNMKNKHDCYIIEANKSGAKVLLRNIIVWLKDNDKLNIEYYDFFNGTWEKTNELKDFTVDIDLKKAFSIYGEGTNADDVIITKVQDSKVQYSEYFLFSTLTSCSIFKKIIDIGTERSIK